MKVKLKKKHTQEKRLRKAIWAQEEDLAGGPTIGWSLGKGTTVTAW
jgi:hypothetical protein